MDDYRRRVNDALNVIRRYTSYIESGDYDAMEWDEVELIERILEGKMDDEDREDIEDLRLTCESLDYV